jgi:hypothetical protein
MSTPFLPHNGTWFEVLKVKSIEVEMAVNLGVRREQYLKAAIQDETIDMVAAYSSSDIVRGLEYEGVNPALIENPCRS